MAKHHIFGKMKNIFGIKAKKKIMAKRALIVYTYIEDSR